MNGEYPIVIDGENVGLLSVRRDGLMTVFEADCRDVERLIRLSVFGRDGSEGRLGVMIPQEGRLFLRKCFSRSALEAMPQEIVCAAEAGKPPQEDTAAEEKLSAADCGAEEKEQEDTVWLPLPEGALISLDTPAKLALPRREGSASEEERMIEGKRYAVISADEIAIAGGPWYNTHTQND